MNKILDGESPNIQWIFWEFVHNQKGIPDFRITHPTQRNSVSGGWNRIVIILRIRGWVNWLSVHICSKLWIYHGVTLNSRGRKQKLHNAAGRRRAGNEMTKQTNQSNHSIQVEWRLSSRIRGGRLPFSCVPLFLLSLPVMFRLPSLLYFSFKPSFLSLIVASSRLAFFEYTNTNRPADCLRLRNGKLWLVNLSPGPLNTETHLNMIITLTQFSCACSVLTSRDQINLTRKHMTPFWRVTSAGWPLAVACMHPACTLCVYSNSKFVYRFCVCNLTLSVG